MASNKLTSSFIYTSTLQSSRVVRAQAVRVWLREDDARLPACEVCDVVCEVQTSGGDGVEV